MHCAAGSDCFQRSHARCGYGWCLHVGTEQAGPGQVYRLAGAFYNIAKIVASGGLVWLAGALLVGFGGVEGATEAVRHEATRHAWMTVMLILAAVMLLLGFYHMRMLPSGGAAASGAKSARETWEQLVAVIKDFFLKKHIWYYIAFIILYRLAEGFVMKIVPLFLEGGAFGRWLGTE